MSEWWAGFWFGVVVAYSPSVLVLALLLWRTMERPSS